MGLYRYLGEQGAARAKAPRWEHTWCVSGLARLPVLVKGSKQERKVSKVSGATLGPCGHRLTLAFSLSVRESPWMLLSKGMNKDRSGYRRRKGARRNRKMSEQASTHPGRRC